MALDQTTALQRVDQRDHRGPVDAEPLRDLLLGQQALLGEEGEHGQFPAVDPVRRQRGVGERGVAKLRVLEQVAEPRPGQGASRRPVLCQPPLNPTASDIASRGKVVFRTLIDATSLGESVVQDLADIGAEGYQFSSSPAKYEVVSELARMLAEHRLAENVQRARVPVVVGALRLLGLDAPILDRLAEVPVLGHGEPVGVVRSVARFQRA